MQVTRDQTERPHGASLQLNIDIECEMYRIGGRLRSEYASIRGVALWIPPFAHLVSNWPSRTGGRTVLGGQFDWGGRLPKSNGGAQRFPQNGWKSFAECNGIRELNCETYKSSRWETRA